MPSHYHSGLIYPRTPVRSVKFRKIHVITANRLLTLAAVLTLAGAFFARPALAEGDAAQGETLAYTCMGCHGIPGYRNAYPSYRVPKIGGQKPAYLEGALKAYRAGTRPHPTMQAQGTTLSDQDIEDLAAYFAGDDVATDGVTADMIQGIDAAQTCLACHGAQAAGVVPTPPTLSGQHEDYLVHALYQYKNNKRTGNVMTAFAGALSDDDIAAIAEFYSRLDGLTTPDKDE